MASPTHEESGPVNVLIVDDVQENRLALKAVLSSPDYRIVEASSGAEALRRLLAEEFAVLLVDVVMPGLNGFELATAIKERDRTAAVPILFLTGQATEVELIYKGYGVGAVDYLVKPVVPEMVRAKVAVFAELYRQRKHIEHQGEALLAFERERNELRLVELRLANERRFRSLADALPHIIWTARPDGAIDYFNQKWFEYTGISALQAAGSWELAAHPDDVETSRLWHEALRSGRELEAECRLRRADGSYRWHLFRAVPEQGATVPQLVAWLGTFTDIEDQKRAQAVLSEFKGTLDAVLDLVVIFDAEQWRFRYLNQGASILLGYPQEELSQMRLVDFMAEHDEARFRELLAPLRNGAESRVTLETRCTRKDGREIPVEFSFQIVPAGGRHVVAIARDITERKVSELEREQLYREALDAIRARDEFLSIASHELRTPLSSLKLQLENMLRPGGEAPESFRDRLAVAARQAERLTRLISQLLDVTRITSGRLHLELEECDLKEVAADVVNRFRADAAKAKSPVTLGTREPVVGKFDRLRVEQVVTNLLANALKFGAGKPIEVEVAAAGECARLVVRDHGIGIPPEDAKRIFLRFERAKSAKTYAGLGLGLYIVRHIVEAHGGTIRVESQPGAGSTFIVELPRSPPAQTVESPPDASADADAPSRDRDST